MSYLYTYGEINTDKGTNSFFPLDYSLNDYDFSGIYITAPCFEEVKRGDILYYNKHWNAWGKSKATSLNTLPSRGLAIVDCLATFDCQILIYGTYNNPSWSFDITSDKTIYTSPYTAGYCLTSTYDIPDTYREPIGIAFNKNQGHFHFYGLWMYNFV